MVEETVTRLRFLRCSERRRWRRYKITLNHSDIEHFTIETTPRIWKESWRTCKPLTIYGGSTLACSIATLGNLYPTACQIFISRYCNCSPRLFPCQSQPLLPKVCWIKWWRRRYSAWINDGEQVQTPGLIFARVRSSCVEPSPKRMSEEGWLLLQYSKSEAAFAFTATYFHLRARRSSTIASTVHISYFPSSSFL
jgi:hypothetical protein